MFVDRRNRQRQRGFSLIEVLIVIAILGILGTLAISNLVAAKADTELAKAEQELTFHLMQARTLSLSEECGVRMIFEADGTYYYERQDRDTLAWIQVPVETGTGARRFPIGVTLTGNSFPSGMPVFTPRGTLTVGGTLTLTARNGNTATLVGNLASGRFQLDIGGMR